MRRENDLTKQPRQWTVTVTAGASCTQLRSAGRTSRASICLPARAADTKRDRLRLLQAFQNRLGSRQSQTIRTGLDHGEGGLRVPNPPGGFHA